jgi:hypothetical protein
LKVAVRYGWLPGARYTNLRDIAGFKVVGLIDVDWKAYSYGLHLRAVKEVHPLVTVAQDVEDIRDLPRVLEQAQELSIWCQNVVVVPKDPKFAKLKNSVIPRQFILGYSVPTRYGGTRLAPAWFGQRRVHLLGGRPDAQYRLSKSLNVVSFDGNRFTLDAVYGDYFDGVTFRPHQKGGYYRCIKASLRNINKLWADS